MYMQINLTLFLVTEPKASIFCCISLVNGDHSFASDASRLLHRGRKDDATTAAIETAHPQDHCQFIMFFLDDETPFGQKEISKTKQNVYQLQSQVMTPTKSLPPAL